MPMSFEDWCKLVRSHDLTYAYSDDHYVWQRGQAQRDLIMREAKNFPLSEVRHVWNTELVDKFLIPEARAEFYWREPRPETTPEPRPEATAEEKE